MQERSGFLSIFFARIPPTVSVEELMALFSQYGRVMDLNLFRRWATARTSKGCGVVTYTHHAAAAAALEALNGKTLHFSNLICAEVVVEWVDNDKVAKTVNAQAMSRSRKTGKVSGANGLEQRVLGTGKQLPDPFGSNTNVCWNALVVPRPAGSRRHGASFTGSTSNSSSLQDEANSEASLPMGGAKPILPLFQAEHLMFASDTHLGIGSFAGGMGSALSLGLLEAPPISGAAASLVQQQLNIPSRAVDTISVDIPDTHVCYLAGLMNTMAGMTNTRMALEASGSSGFLLSVTGAPEDLLAALQLLDAVFAS
eukprot:gene8563-8745_t